MQVQEGEKILQKTYDLDPDIDSFWSDNTTTPFQNIGSMLCCIAYTVHTLIILL